MTLELRPDCEHCGRDLPAHLPGAFICSFECTFCQECVEGPLNETCPNCGGEFQPRPLRSLEKLQSSPASMVRRGPQ